MNEYIQFMGHLTLAVVATIIPLIVVGIGGAVIFGAIKDYVVEKRRKK